MNPILLKNGVIVTETNILKGYSIIIKEGIIDQIILSSKMIHNQDFTTVDCKNCYIMPGLIDIHSDSIEKIIVPRKGTKFSVDHALYDIDRQMICQGITSIYHSMTMANTSICNNRRTIKPNDVFHLCDLITPKNDLLINHRVHIRLELNTLDVVDDLVQYIKENRVHELSFMDHTPGQGQYRDIKEFEKVIYQQYGEISDDKKKEIIDICKSKRKLDRDQIQILIKSSLVNGVAMAYHDVETREQIDWMAENNIKICEFPLNDDVAEYAMQKNLFCVVGSPNIIMGRSQYNNASAVDLLVNNRANVISSDYFSSSLLGSIFILNRLYNIPLPTAVGFATINPAAALGISEKQGSIAEGKKADIIIVDASTEFPRVNMSIINGIIKMKLNYLEEK